MWIFVFLCIYGEVVAQLDINKCLSDPCENNGTCTDTTEGYTCSCPTGYQGIHCENDIDECQQNVSCSYGSTCINSPGGYHCLCQSGWQGQNCNIDINECQQNVPCSYGSTCINSPGGYHCLCQSGWQGQNCNIGSWIEWTGNEYFYGSTSQTWFSAKNMCEYTLNAKLAVITSSEENNFLKQLVPTEILGAKENAWIGLRSGNTTCRCVGVGNPCTACRESWTWYDGTPMLFYQWYTEEPDGGNSKCGRLTREGWADYSCNYRFYYLCKRERERESKDSSENNNNSAAISPATLGGVLGAVIAVLLIVILVLVVVIIRRKGRNGRNGSSDRTEELPDAYTNPSFKSDTYAELADGNIGYESLKRD